MKRAIFALAACLIAAPATAQKSKDTVRFALKEPIVGVDTFYDPKEETSLSSRAVFDTLIDYDEEAVKMRPLLAKAWRRIDPLTLEFDLRDDVKWHDGKPFTADDVVYTVQWLLDPATKLRFKSGFLWVKSIEKLGPYKVRFHAKRPFALDLFRIANSFHIYPKHVHGILPDKSGFGRNPVGTGPYRAVSVSADNGIVLERNETYKHGGTWKKATNVKRFHLVPVPEQQTQIAKLLAGSLDVIGDLTKDQIEALGAYPNVATTLSTNFVYAYLLLDAKGRNGKKPTTDKRVRRAIFAAIDRAAIARNVVSSEARPLDAICDPRQFGCATDVIPPGYDPAAAKKLLAEAGYANGFDLEIITTGRTNQIGDAVANFLRKIGIKASVRPLTFVAYRRLQRQGKYSALVSGWTSFGGMPDSGAHMDFFYGSPARDFAGDQRLVDITKESGATHDEAKRKALFREAFTRINENAYVIVISTLPAQLAHSKELSIRKGSLAGLGVSVFDISWK